jgi:hypothetical protein
VIITGIILVDSMDSIIKTETSPFDSNNNMYIESPKFPVRLEDGRWHYAENIFTGLGEGPDALAARRFLFGSTGEHTTERMAGIMALATAISAWEANVQYLESRFNRSRHEAIADPSLHTFHPLTLLRRNIADLEDALVSARKLVEPSSEDWIAAAQDITHDKRCLEFFVPQYDALLNRVNAMSTRLNNEIQLVIGSVTVQVCQPMLISLHTLN